MRNLNWPFLLCITHTDEDGKNLRYADAALTCTTTEAMERAETSEGNPCDRA
jgi:hypothetical protein